MRIYIIGGPGSGKSYLAEKLSKQFDVESFHLDNIHWHKDDVNFTVKADEKVRDKEFKKIVSKKDWIIEGVFSSWVKEGFDKADMILFLRTNKYRRAFRLCLRNLKAWLGIVKRKIGSWKASIALQRWNFMWDTKKLPEIQERLKKYKNKVFYFNSADAAFDHIKLSNASSKVE